MPVEASSGVGSKDILDPVEVLAHLDVDSGVAGLSTSLTPGHQAVDLVEAHQGAAGVALASRGRAAC